MKGFIYNMDLYNMYFLNLLVLLICGTNFHIITNFYDISLWMDNIPLQISR